MNLIRKVNVNISFYDLVKSIPKYAKFVKDLITNKNKVREHLDVVPLSASCSLILRKRHGHTRKNERPRKLYDSM